MDDAAVDAADPAELEDAGCKLGRVVASSAGDDMAAAVKAVSSYDAQN